jgi:hypothetical protein
VDVALFVGYGGYMTGDVFVEVAGLLTASHATQSR